MKGKLYEQRREIAEQRHENHRLERSLAKKSIKIDALDLAASHKRSRSIADLTETEHLQVKFLSKNEQIRNCIF